MLNKEEIVYKGENNQALTTSLMVAKVFEKEHRNVVRDIRNLIKEGMLKIEHTPMFVESTYINKQNNQKYPMYVMNRDGFTLLAMGFTGEKALRFKLEYINAFNAMEQQIREVVASYQISDPIKRAERWIEEEKERQRLQVENQQKEQLLIEQEPKVNFANAMITSTTSCLVGELAKIITQNGYTIGQNRLFAWLRDNGYLGRWGERKNIPLQQYVEQGLFQLKKTTWPDRNNVMHTSTTVKVTGKGQQYFINKFLNNKNNK